MKLAKVLNDAQIRSLSRQPGMWAVGVVSGLVLQVSPDGAASWVLRATYGGRVRSMGLDLIVRYHLSRRGSWLLKLAH
jgi:hypothetical protein